MGLIEQVREIGAGRSYVSDDDIRAADTALREEMAARPRRMPARSRHPPGASAAVVTQSCRGGEGLRALRSGW